jgi:hypothetical protein
MEQKPEEQSEMPLFRKKVKVEDIHPMEGLKPLEDETLLYLWQQAIKGSIPVYFAAVPLELIEPYDKEYDPRKHPVGKKVIETMIQAWQKNQFQPVWVYPKGDKFILSDDYCVYYAALTGQPDYVPCWILGKTDHHDVKDMQGPIEPEEINKMLFG